MDPVAHTVDTCLRLTTRMLEAAERDDWQTVAELDAERRACFDGVALSDSGAEALEYALQMLRTTLTLDGQLRERAIAARDKALHDLREIRARRHGQARYRAQSLGG